MQTVIVAGRVPYVGTSKVHTSAVAHQALRAIRELAATITTSAREHPAAVAPFARTFLARIAACVLQVSKATLTCSVKVSFLNAPLSRYEDYLFVFAFVV